MQRLFLLFVKLEYCKESLGRYLNGSELAHFLFAFLLLFKQLFLSRDIATVALCKNVLAHGLDGLASDDFAADGGLNGYLEKLAGDIVLELFTQLPRSGIGLVLVRNEAERIDLIAV